MIVLGLQGMETRHQPYADDVAESAFGRCRPMALMLGHEW
jgi:hypothetical protein